MSNNLLKIILPDFREPNGENDETYLIKAKINENLVGKYSIYVFDRYDFVDQTEYAYTDFGFFARRLEFYEHPYLNCDGMNIFVISDFEFSQEFDEDYKIAFLRDSVKRIAEKLDGELADIYALCSHNDIEIYKQSGFENVDNDEVYGVWMHYSVS